MGRQAFALLLLMLICFVATEAQLEEPVAQIKEDFFDFPQCKPVQSFIIARKYTYQYEGIIESQQHEIRNGALLRCSVEIKIPYQCAGTMSFKHCHVFGGTPFPNGTLVYTNPSPLDNVAKLMRQNSVYFHFVDGRITKVFADNSEPSDILNIKKAALSVLQINFSALRVAGLNAPVEYEEENIFGIGNVSARISTVAVGAPRQVTVTRDTTNFKHPWSIKEYGEIHTTNENSDLRAIASDLVVSVAHKLEKPPVQECSYMLERGRLVEEVRCVETKPVFLTNNPYFKALSDLLYGNTANAKARVQLNMNRLADERMEPSDRITSVERDQIKARYERHSVMYEAQWKETIDGLFVNFDPVAVVRDLITTPNGPFTAGKFAKLAQYISTLPNHGMWSLWENVSNAYTGEQRETLTILWVQLLYRCSIVSLRCHLPTCQEALACQNGFHRFLRNIDLTTDAVEIESGVMKAMTTFEKPNVNMVAAAHYFATQRTTPLRVLTLGKVLARHMDTCELDTLEPQTIEAINYLKTLLNTDCSISITYNEHELIMLAAIKSLSALPTNAGLNGAIFVNCAYNVHAPVTVALEAVRSLKNVPVEPAMRTKILSIFTDNSRLVTLRLSCYAYLINNNPTEAEFRSIANIVSLDPTPKAVKHYVKEHIKAQIQYRGTRYCVLSERSGPDNLIWYIPDIAVAFNLGFATVCGSKNCFADIVMKSLRRNNWAEIDLYNEVTPVTEKEYNFARSIFVPYLEREVNFYVKSHVVFPQNSIFPLLADVAIMGEWDSRNITLMELTADLNNMLSLVRPLLGSKGIFAEPRLEQLLNLPFYQLMDSATSALPPLTEEELRNLAQIQDEAYVAFNMLKMQSSMPVYVKLLNKEIDLNRLIEMPWLRKMNLMKLWTLSQEFESGKSYRSLEANEPLRMDIASPTSIGLPHVQSTSLTYYYNLRSSVTAQIRNIFLYNRGTLSVQAKPLIRSSMEWSHKIQFPGGATCGAGYLLNAGHSSDISVSIDVEPNQVSVNVAPLHASTELLSITSNIMAVKNGVLKVIPRASECAETCLSSNCNRGTYLQYKNCYNNPMDIGLYLRSDQRYYYKMRIATGLLNTVINEQNVESKGMEFVFGRSINPTEEDIADGLKMAVKYIPTLSEVRWEYAFSSGQPWIVSLKSAVQLVDEEVNDSPLDYYLAVAKVTRPDGSIVYNNELKIARQSTPDNNFLELFRYFSHHTAEATTYTVTGKFQFPVIGYYSAKGLVKSESSSLSSYTARVQLNKGLLETPGPSVGHFSIKTKPVTDGTMSGYLTEATVDSLNIPMVPFTQINMHYRSVNDTAGNCNNILHAEALRRDGRPVPFVNLRYDIARSAPSSVALKATLTCNIWQTQIDITSPNTTTLITTTRYVVPEKMFPNTLMESNVQNEVRILDTNTEYNPTCVTLAISACKTVDDETYFKMDITTTASRHPILRWSLPASLSYYAYLTLKPNRCAKCHHLDVNLPNLRINSRLLDSEARIFNWQMDVNINRGVMSYLYLPDKIVNLLNHFYTDENLRFGILQSFEEQVPEKKWNVNLMYYVGERRFEISANLATPTAKVWNNVLFTSNILCTRCVPLLESQFTTDFSYKFKELEKSELTEFAPQDCGYLHEMSLVHNHQGLVVIDTYLRHEIIAGSKLHRLRSKFNFKYSNLRNSLLTMWTDVIELPFAINVTARPNSPANGFAYDVALSYGRNSLWEGTFTQAPVPVTRFPEICTASETCMYRNFSLWQMNNCPDFSVYYAGHEEANVYRSTRCSFIGWDYIKSGSSRKGSVVIDGKHDPSVFIDYVAVTYEQTASRRRMTWLSELPRPTRLFPIRTEFSMLVEPSPMRMEVNLDTGTVDFAVRYTLNEEFFVSMATKNLPLEVDCTYRTTVDASTMSMSIPRCTLRYRPLTGEAIYNTTVIARMSSLRNWNINANCLASSEPLLMLKLAMAESTLSTRVLCGSATNPNPPCNIRATFSPSTFVITSNFYSKNVNCSWANNELLIGVQTPLILFRTSLNMAPNENVRVTVTFNSPSRFTNSLVYEGELRSMNLEGESVRLPGIVDPCSWRCVYRISPDVAADLDMLMNIGKITYKYRYYKGRNNPVIPDHIPSAPASSQLNIIRLNYRACSSLVLFENVNIFTEDRARLLSTKINATINAWPFVEGSAWNVLVSPVLPLRTCWTCLGPLEMFANYDATRTNEERIDVVSRFANAADIVMNYTTGPRESNTALFLRGATTITLGRRDETARPVWSLVNDIHIAPSSIYKVDIQSNCEGCGINNIVFITRNEYRVSTSLMSSMQLRNALTSLRYSLAVDSTRARLTFSYPDTRDALVMADFDVNKDQLTVRDVKFTTWRHDWRLRGMTVRLLRDIDQRLVGFNMQNMRLTRTCNCGAPTPCACDFTIVGSAEASIGGEWNIDIRDIAGKMITVKIALTPGAEITVGSLIHLDMPTIYMDMDFNALYSTALIKENLTWAIEMTNPNTGKMVPVIKTRYRSNFAPDPTTKIMTGAFDLTVYRWYFLSPEHATPYHISLTLGPNNEIAGREITATMQVGDRWTTTQHWLISTECLATYDVFGLQICDPRRMILNATVDLPLMKSNAMWTFNDNHWTVLTDFSILRRTATGCEPIYMFREHMDVEWNTNPNAVTGVYNFTSEMMWPIDLRTSVGIRMTPTADRTSNIISTTLNLGSIPQFKVIYSPSSVKGSNNVRVVTSENELILNGDLTLSDCLEEVSVICIPTTWQLSNVDVNVPFTSVLRAIPLLKRFVPDNGMFDLTLEHSQMTMIVHCAGMGCTITTNMQLNGPSMPDNLIMHSTLTMSAETCSYHMTLNHWNTIMNWEWTPATMAFTSEHTITTTWIKHHVITDFPGILMVNHILFQLETMGEMREFLPIDIDMEYRKPTTDTWMLNVRSCAVCVPSVMMFNVSMIMDNTMNPVRLRWEITTERYPMLNHITSVVIRTTVPREAWSCDLMVSNIFCWTKSTWNLTPRSALLNQLVVGLPDNAQGVDIRYETDATTNVRTVRMTYTDNDTLYKCTGTPVPAVENTLAFTCIRTEPPSGKAPPRPVTVAEWRLDASYVIGYDMPNADWLKVMRFLFTFNYSHCLDETWIAETLRTRFHVNDPDLCTRLSSYLCAENNKLIERWNKSYDPEIVNQAMHRVNLYMKPYYDLIEPYTSNIATYLSKDYLRFSMESINHDDVFRVEVTCPKCDRPLATFELRLTRDARNRSIATLSCTSPIMTSTLTFTARLPMRPLHFHWSMGGYDITMTMEMNDNNALMGMTANVGMPNGRTVRCQAERTTPTAMTMPCICNEMEGETVGPEIARFNIPILFMDSFYNKINQWATYSKLMNITTLIKQELGLSVKASHDLDSYLTSLKKYIYDVLYTYYTDGKSILDGRLYIPFGAVEVHMMTPSNNLLFGWNIGLTSKIIPELNQALEISVIDEANNPVLCTRNRNIFSLVGSKWNLRTMEFIDASFSLVDSTESVNITAVHSSDSNWIRELRFRFNDVNAQPYTCALSFETTVRFTCNVESEIYQGPVCNAEWTKEELYDAKNWIKLSMLATPMLYKAAHRPIEFKREIAKMINFTNLEARDVLCDYISKKSLKMINYMNERSAHYIKKYSVDYVAKYYNQELVKMILEGFLLSSDAPNWFTNSQSFEDYIRDVLSYFGEYITQELIDRAEQIYHYGSKVEILSRRLYQVMTPSYMKLDYELTDYVQFFREATENIHYYHYVSAKRVFHQSWSVKPNWYETSSLIEYIWAILLDYNEATYYNILTPTINQVITNKGEYLELPVPESTSTCSYVYATDPIRNRFSVISKGTGLILALPGKLIELASARTAYVTTNARELVKLPYISDDVICRYNGDVAYCECPYMSLRVKFGTNSRVMRTISFYNDIPFVVGALGAYAEITVPTRFLPNGDEAQTTTELLSSYRLQESCPVAMNHISSHWDIQSKSAMDCSQRLPDSAKSMYPIFYHSFKRACSLGSAGEYAVDACWYRQALVKQTLMGSKFVDCCPRNVDKSLFILLSLSRDSNRMSAARIARKIAIRAKKSDMAYDSMVLVTYGGVSDKYDPSPIELNTLSDSEIRQIFRDLSLNGPRYSHQSTERALQYVADHYKSTGAMVIAKSLVVVAPEKLSENCGMSDMSDLVQSLSGDLTSVFMYSGLTHGECKSMHVDVVLNTGGVCVSKSTRAVFEQMVDRTHKVVKAHQRC